MLQFTIAVVLVAAAAAAPERINECLCHENGNYYSPISADNCESFSQRTAFLPEAIQNCPPGLVFDVTVCVCNWPNAAPTCPANCQDATPPPPPADFCESHGNIYAPVPGTSCSRFTQATAVLPPQEHSCPAGLQFNLDVCVCDWPWRTTCSV